MTLTCIDSVYFIRAAVNPMPHPNPKDLVNWCQCEYANNWRIVYVFINM